MGTIYIDGKPYKADSEQNLLHACLSLGFDLPYFCWHAALGSVGACRQCAVKHFKDAKDTHGKIVMACMTPAVPETRISIFDPEAAAFRAGIIEGMMLNHPHDCPVCDEGGECHLQDMTVMTGHNYRRTRFEKRTFHDQYLGPFVYHEMNRCIQCYRCVRFYREYAGGNDLNSLGIRNAVYFARDEDGVLESEFAGNLVEVCPTGVFTDRTLRRHYTRKWDLRMAPSICAHCSVGCNVTIGERYGLLRRVLTRFNREVNGYFLCDRGRFGYEFVNSGRRIRAAKLDGEFISSEEAARQLQSLVSTGSRPIGIGSPRASLEANFALRQMVGKDRFFAGVADGEWETISSMVEILQTGPARSPSLHDIELSDAVLILGEDVTNSAPRMALSLRQSVRQQPFEIVQKLRIPSWMDAAVREVVQDRKGPLFIAAPGATRLDDVATRAYRAAPDDVARLGFAVAHEIDPAAPGVVALTEDVRELARVIAGALKAAKRPVVISGASCRSEVVIESAANVARALCDSGHPAGLSFIASECNSFGLALIGARPLREAFSITRNGEAAPDHPRERSLSASSSEIGGQFSGIGNSGRRARSPGEQDHGESRPAASRQHLRRIRRHAGEQRREGAAVLSGIPATESGRRRCARRCSGKLAVAGRSGMAFARRCTGNRREGSSRARSRSPGRAPRKVPHGQRENSPRVPSLQRAHFDHGKYQRGRAQATR
jgi:NADH-quinone oxidoreductase subunit G